MTGKRFFTKLVQRLEIGHAVGKKQELKPFEHLEDDEDILWSAVNELYQYLVKCRRWNMRDMMTPGKVEEIRDRMHRIFCDLMAEDVERNDYENLTQTKKAHAAWQEAFNDLAQQYALA